MSINLPIKHRIALAANNLLSSLHLDRRVRIELEEQDGLITCILPQNRMTVPSAVRWRFYKRGLQARLKKLLYQFGVDEHVSIGSGDVVFDIGANVGEFTLGMLEKGARVVSIEGDPMVFKCLSKNMTGKQNVQICENVLWKEETELVYYSEPNEANSSVIKPPETRYAARELRLQATTLDALAARLDITAIDLLKCDAEGAEPEVISGGRDILKRTRQVVFDTGAERMGEETSDEVEQLLTELGFRVFHDTRPNRKMTFGIRD